MTEKCQTQNHSCYIGRQMFDRSRRRLAAWFTLSMGSILILFAFTQYQRQIVEQQREFDAEIQTMATKLAKKSEQTRRSIRD